MRESLALDTNFSSVNKKVFDDERLFLLLHSRPIPNYYALNIPLLSIYINIYELLKVSSCASFSLLAFEKMKLFCGYCVVRDSDRFITSLLVLYENCDSFKTLFVFSINLCLCKRLPAALCCLCFDSKARNQRR